MSKFQEGPLFSKFKKEQFWTLLCQKVDSIVPLFDTTCTGKSEIFCWSQSAEGEPRGEGEGLHL